MNTRVPPPVRVRIVSRSSKTPTATASSTKMTVFADGPQHPLRHQPRLRRRLGIGQFAGHPLSSRTRKARASADKKEVVVSGFGRSDTHELPNSLTWGPDGWLYGFNGVFNPAHVVQNPGKTFDFTCAPCSASNPRTREFQALRRGHESNLVEHRLERRGRRLSSSLRHRPFMAHYGERLLPFAPGWTLSAVHPLGRWSCFADRQTAPPEGGCTAGLLYPRQRRLSRGVLRGASCSMGNIHGILHQRGRDQAVTPSTYAPNFGPRLLHRQRSVVHAGVLGR